MSAQSRASRIKIVAGLGKHLLRFVPMLVRRMIRGLNQKIARFAQGTCQATLPLHIEFTMQGYAPLREALGSHHSINSPPTGFLFLPKTPATAPFRTERHHGKGNLHLQHAA